MADIKDRIKKIKPYFQGMQVENLENEQVVYVVVKFPEKWFIDDEIPNKFNVTVGDNDDLHYFCASIDDGFDAVFDAIEYNINKMVTAQERADLLVEKIKQLKELFTDETISLDVLKTLEFSYKGSKKKDKKALFQPLKKDDKEDDTDNIEEVTNVAS